MNNRINTPPPKRGILTIAIGKKYAIQAKYLAHSCMLHASHIIRAVITDQPEILEPFFDIIVPYNSDLSDPFSVKTRLNVYTPFEQTLFLDADSLIINNIDSYWDFLEERSFAYRGDVIDHGEWYGDITELIKKVNVPWMSKLNTGMFLFDRSELADKVFDTAFYYFFNHKKENINMEFFRKNLYSDEPFISIGLAKNNIKPVEDSRRFSRGLMSADNIHINVIKGIASIRRGKNIIFPLVVHFCSRGGRLFFFREKIRLFFYFNSVLDIISTSIILFIINFFNKFIRTKEKVL